MEGETNYWLDNTWMGTRTDSEVVGILNLATAAHFTVRYLSGHILVYTS